MLVFGDIMAQQEKTPDAGTAAKLTEEENAALLKAQLELFRKLKASGEKRLYYVPADKLLGTDAEACVDGVHFTDLGMIRYAACLEPVIKSALRNSK